MTNNNSTCKETRAETHRDAVLAPVCPQSPEAGVTNTLKTLRQRRLK